MGRDHDSDTATGDMTVALLQLAMLDCLGVPTPLGTAGSSLLLPHTAHERQSVFIGNSSNNSCTIIIVYSH